MSPPSRGRVGFWSNDQTKHLYDAMKKAREEIADAIRKRKLICFETVPMNFEEEGYSLKKHQGCRCDDETGQDISNWSVIAEQILDPQKDMQDLKRALDKVCEITEHDLHV